MTNDHQTVYHSGATASVRITDSWDLLTYARYAEPEAEARIAYDEACMTTERERAKLDHDLDDLLLFQRTQPACVAFQWQIIRADHAAIAQCERAEAAAWHHLQRVQDDLSAGRL